MIIRSIKELIKIRIRKK